MTKAAKAFGKRIDNFLVNEETRRYLEALTALVPGKPVTSVQRGNGLLPGVGTWAHPKLAVFFARWLDVRFAVWCDSVIDDILRGKAELVVTKPEESAVAALPQDYSTALRALADAVDKQREAELAAQQAIAKAAQPRQWRSDGGGTNPPKIHRKFLRGHVIQPRAGFTPRAPGRTPAGAATGVLSKMKGGVHHWPPRLSRACAALRLPLVGLPEAGPKDAPPRPPLPQQLQPEAGRAHQGVMLQQ